MPPLNKNNSAVKRIMQEAKELANDPSADYTAAPLEDDIFEWHCTLRGPPGTEFEGGLYHLRVLLPAEYPFRPPSIMLLTPNGRFELNTKICISFTNYHEELWQPAWGVRTALIGLQGFFPLRGQAAAGVGSIEASPAERRRLAALSKDWVCPQCKQPNHEILPEASETPSSSSTSAETPVTLPEAETTSIMPPAQQIDAEPEQRSSDEEQLVGSSVDRAPEHLERAPSPPTLASTAPPIETSMPVPGASTTVSSPPRPPLLLDAAIGCLVILALAMLCRRVL
ncbi:UBC-like protein [Cylindrobasidium torrendii FP15055 ss-10]|uniref:UBC-like protein n=1 Tax=Cylindrobasidium torrendii FP15055 ss-10 TaxID=1314674 RepID=A0A0D7B3F8_9AGAR|nr:UBC-like protein [Cylindrobasidium torrendii FP15055 ss-10]